MSTTVFRSRRAWGTNREPVTARIRPKRSQITLAMLLESFRGRHRGSLLVLVRRRRSIRGLKVFLSASHRVSIDALQLFHHHCVHAGARTIVPVLVGSAHTPWRRVRHWRRCASSVERSAAADRGYRRSRLRWGRFCGSRHPRGFSFLLLAWGVLFLTVRRSRTLLALVVPSLSRTRCTHVQGAVRCPSTLSHPSARRAPRTVLIGSLWSPCRPASRRREGSVGIFSNVRRRLRGEP